MKLRKDESERLGSKKMSEFNPKSILEQAKTELDEAQSLAGLEEVSRRYLGDKGLIRSFFKEISSLSDKERKGRGSALNRLRQEITDLAELRKKELGKGLSEKTLREETESLDLKVPKIGHLHPITQTVRMMNKTFTEMGYSVMDGSEIETDEYNFQRLNVPKNHPARDMQDTIYIEEPNYLLRTQTS